MTKMAVHHPKCQTVESGDWRVEKIAGSVILRLVKQNHNCRFDCLSGSVYLDVFLSIILQVAQPKGE